LTTSISTTKRKTQTPAVTETNKRRKSSAIRKEQTRKNILLAARKIFAKKGFESANVSDIVQKVNMSQGIFYYHFPDKKSVLIEVLNTFFDRMRALVDSWMTTTEAGPEIAGRFARDISGILYENRDLAHIIMKEAHSTDPEIRGVIHDFYNYLYERTAAGLQLGIALGLVRPLDTRITAVALVGMIERVVYDLIDSGKPIDMEHAINEITNLQNRGIRP
jgi:TetR/AcrR family transcriptional regulator, fatty acid metabolism regulator protein